MANKYKQPSLSNAVRFQRAPLADLEMSKMRVNPRVYTTYNAGDIVPVFYQEVLPHSTFSVDVDFINRLLSATIKPTMGSMQLDIFAFFVPNRIINDSWKNVQGENTSGFWSAPEIELAPLYPMNLTADVQVPPMSVADYYGYSSQLPIKAEVLQQCNDLKIKGYLSIYNSYFRDENYQPPINFSKLNVYQGFFEPVRSMINPSSSSDGDYVALTSIPDGSFPDGALSKSVFGEGDAGQSSGLASMIVEAHLTDFSALDRPLKANKLHDAFTSVLPSPQKGTEVFFGIGDSAPLVKGDEINLFDGVPQFKFNNQLVSGLTGSQSFYLSADLNNQGTGRIAFDNVNTSAVASTSASLLGTDLVADLSKATGISINDLRHAAAIQQVYEMLGRNGSRYLEALRSFFGIQAENPFKDIPTQLGHIRRELDLYQVAQTSGSVEGETPQGNLSGFGYTAKEGNLFTYTALEHGYIHYMAVVRQRNIYPSLMLPDNFRKTTLDWYLPQLANIGEQPIRLATLNPFVSEAMDKTIGFQEAWALDYRYEPDRVSGYCRTGLADSLDIWTYADSFDGDFTHVNGEWLKSNAQEVLDRTLAVTSALSPQFLIMLEFKTTKQLPMPIYSVPGLDII